MIRQGLYNFLKRLFDIIFSIILLSVISPFLIILSLVLFLIYGSPIFFLQKRLGKNCKPFTIIKFKSLLDLYDSNGDSLPEIERLTIIYSLMRSFSIDELPSLINVLKGDMSLVGPRPLLAEYLSEYNSKQIKRHDVFPGITGWAQINGRNMISWEERFKMDLWYVENQSFYLDIKILLLTFLTILKREGINQSSISTMEKFKNKEKNMEKK